MRKKFDDNSQVKDPRQVQKLIEEAEHELWSKQHPQLRKFAMSPGGVAYEREVIPPDWVLDFWDPLEKAQYPEYFARREERKKEYLKIWDSQYGGKGAKDEHHWARAFVMCVHWRNS